MRSSCSYGGRSMKLPITNSEKISMTARDTTGSNWMTAKTSPAIRVSFYKRLIVIHFLMSLYKGRIYIGVSIKLSTRASLARTWAAIVVRRLFL